MRKDARQERLRAVIIITIIAAVIIALSWQHMGPDMRWRVIAVSVGILTVTAISLQDNAWRNPENSAGNDPDDAPMGDPGELDPLAPENQPEPPQDEEQEKSASAPRRSAQRPAKQRARR